MRNRKILLVLGTRPEAIKLAPVIRALDAHPSTQPIVCVTGQHRALLDQVLGVFGIRPDFDLDIMQPNQTLADVAARILVSLQPVIDEVSPDYTLVQGDTTTCFAASLASFYRGVPVGHVEAGLRTWNLQAPFPEEAHRAMVGRIANLHFAPTDQARRNLLREGTDPASVYVTGNTVIDALHVARDALAGLSKRELERIFGTPLFRRLSESGVPVVLVTGHRRENLGARLDTVAKVVRDLAEKHPRWCFVYLLHPNPNSRKSPKAVLGGLDNVFMIEPLEYLPFVWLMTRSGVLLTDSGGLQEEASELGKPILITRDVTERPEVLEQAGAQLVGTSGTRIFRAVEQAILAPAPQPSGKTRHLYGDGTAARRIVDLLWSTLGSDHASQQNVTTAVPSWIAPGHSPEPVGLLQRLAERGAS
jgi:UDP-N-acetylglucosamine 2-epimerase (non-hydrolysing)